MIKHGPYYVTSVLVMGLGSQEHCLPRKITHSGYLGCISWFVCGILRNRGLTPYNQQLLGIDDIEDVDALASLA